MDYKEDLGEEVLKKNVTIQYLKQEAEFTACLTRESCTGKAASWSQRERESHRGFGEAWSSEMSQLSGYSEVG